MRTLLFTSLLAATLLWGGIAFSAQEIKPNSAPIQIVCTNPAQDIVMTLSGEQTSEKFNSYIESGTTRIKIYWKYDDIFSFTSMSHMKSRETAEYTYYIAVLPELGVPLRAGIPKEYVGETKIILELPSDQLEKFLQHATNWACILQDAQA